MKSLTPSDIPPPFANYAHGIEVPAGCRFAFTSGQLGMTVSGEIPPTALGQARICFANCRAIIAVAGMSPSDVVRINAFVTDRSYMSDYMQARDEFTSGLDRLPASTLMIVAGFTRPEFKVEVEMIAAKS